MDSSRGRTFPKRPDAAIRSFSRQAKNYRKFTRIALFQTFVETCMTALYFADEVVLMEVMKQKI